MQQKIYIIAEAGVNHNGSFKQAVKLIDAAVEAKADAIKFQTFIAEECISKNADLAAYQKASIKNKFDSQLDMIRQFELSFDQFRELNALCLKAGIDFLSTPFDFKSIDFLSSLDMTFWKIPSGEINNLPYLREIGSLGKKIIMKNIYAARKSIVAARNIKIGERFTDNNLTVKRPGTGISPMKWDSIIGKTATANYSIDDFIRVNELNESNSSS